MKSTTTIKTLSVLAFFFIIFIWQSRNAACYNCTADGPLNSLSYSSPSFAPDWTTVQTNAAEGRDYMLFNVTKGQIYRWTTYGIEDNNPGINVPCLNTSECASGLTCIGLSYCTNDAEKQCESDAECGAGTCETMKRCELAFDTELTLLKGNCGTTGEVLAYNRNGLYRNQSMIEWKADFDGNVFLLVNNYQCQNSCDQNGLNCMKTSVKWQRIDSSHCTDCSYQYPTTYPVQSPAPAFSTPVLAPSWTRTADNNLKAGEFQIFNVVKGRIYRWSTCSDISYDTQLTLYRGSATEGVCGQFLAYGDDSETPPCADGSKQTVLKWTADYTGTVTILNNEYNCGYCNKSPNPTNPWGHCSVTTMDWQRYDCNTCTTQMTGTTYTPDDTTTTISNVDNGNYILFNLKKGYKYSFRSVEADSSTKFTGMLTLRAKNTTKCSGETLAQSEKVNGSYEQEIIYTATSDFVGELLVTGSDCGSPAAKKATVEYVLVYDPDSRFDNNPEVDGKTWTGVTLDNENGVYIIDNNIYKETWAEAITYCEKLVYHIPSSTDTVDGWILPNINQLYSIVDFDLYDKATSYTLPSYVSSTAGEGAACTLINQETTCGYPTYICGDKQKCVRNNWYWSSTSVVGSSYFSWGVNMKDGRSYRVLKQDQGGVPATKHKVICVKGGASVKGQFDMLRPARERKFSGWACDKSSDTASVDIYLLIRNKNGDNILKSTDYLIKGGAKIPGSSVMKPLYGFSYGKTDMFPADTTKTATDKAIMTANITANCDETKKHAFELDMNDTGDSLVNKIRNALSGQPSPYYVTAYAINEGWIKTFAVLLPQNEPFKLVDVCGDGLRTVGEMCDDGNAITEKCPYNAESCMVCDSACQRVAGYIPQCHDTYLDIPDENCDCGPGYWTLTGTTCTTSLASKRCPGYGDGTSSCTICNEVCRAEIHTVPYCGDGYKDPVEACDDGDLSNNNACKTNCAFNVCGDGYIFNSGAGANETCDDGTKNGYYETECTPGPCCNTTCNGPGPKCGDSILQRAVCTGYPGCVTVPAAAETCDKGAANGGWKTLAQHNLDVGCNGTCTGVAPYCGDGTLQSSYEVCDEGIANQDGVYGKCRTDCSAKPRCGDGKLDGPGGDGLVTGPEVCDAGTNNGAYGFCNLTCTGIAHCGDAILQNTHEQCDLGTGNFSEYAINKDFSCKDNCTIGRWCGDAVLDDGRNLYLNTAAYYQFSEKTGSTTADSSGGGKTGTISYAGRAYGKYGRGVFFDTSSHPANIERVTATGVAAATNLTLEAWVYPIHYAATGGYSTIIVGSGAYYLSLYNDGSLQAYWYGKSPAGYHSTAGSLVPLNVWTHVAAVWDSANVKLYVNGVLRATVATTGTGNASTTTIIGAESIDRQFFGIIDEVAIYTKSLDAAELLSHATGKTGNEYCDTGDADHGSGNLPVGTAVTTYETSCSTQCNWFHFCGDGVLDGPGGTGVTTGPEVCDDGPSGNKGEYTKCNPGCTTLGPRCGDGLKNGPEQCDKAPSNTNTGGEVWTGTNDATATCRTNCTWAKCGDGIVDTGEECDDGINNSDTIPNACRLLCKQSKCGDFTRDSGEECDDGDVSVGGMIVNYLFDEGSGTVATDSTSNSYNGTISGALWYSLGRYGKALYFDGINDYVQVADNNLLEPADISVSLWVNPSVWTGSHRGLVTKRASSANGFFIFYLSGGSLNWDWGGAGYRWSTGYLPPLNTWTHLVFTRDSSGRKLYVNGSLQASTSIAGDSTLVPSTANLRIGYDSSANQYPYNGYVDDVRIYNRALTAAEIPLIKDLNNDSCNNCINARCGDGFQKTKHSSQGAFNYVPDEVCDDGNKVNNDYCRSDCQKIIGSCGDG
ncbi:MAG TPA: hypothetical protein PLZ43_12750, partial [bacterium]|nr:hypothetical protein [bacterium]